MLTDLAILQPEHAATSAATTILDLDGTKRINNIPGIVGKVQCTVYCRLYQDW